MLLPPHVRSHLERSAASAIVLWLFGVHRPTKIISSHLILPHLLEGDSGTVPTALTLIITEDLPEPDDTETAARLRWSETRGRLVAATVAEIYGLTPPDRPGVLELASTVGTPPPHNDLALAVRDAAALGIDIEGVIAEAVRLREDEGFVDAVTAAADALEIQGVVDREYLGFLAAQVVMPPSTRWDP